MALNVTLSAEESLLRSARRKAVAEHTSLNELFQGWLRGYVSKSSTRDSYPRLMEKLSAVEAGGRWSRDDRNARR